MNSALSFLLKVLQAKLSDEAVRRREENEENVDLFGQAMMVLRVQECLHVLLPKMDSEVRRQAKEKLAETKRDLPEALESSFNDFNVEHNLKALIASCDGKAEPAFINVFKSNGGNFTFGRGGGGFGGSGGFGVGKVTEQGQQKTESTVEITQVPVDSVPVPLSPNTDESVLVYDGKSFDQWTQVANTDRLPQSVAKAIQACGALAETDVQREVLLGILSSATRRHGKGRFNRIQRRRWEGD